MELARGNYSNYPSNRVLDYTSYLDGVKRIYEFGHVYIKVNDLLKVQGSSPRPLANLGYKLKLFIGSHSWGTPAKQKLSEFHIYEATADQELPEKEVINLIPVIR